MSFSNMVRKMLLPHKYKINSKPFDILTEKFDSSKFSRMFSKIIVLLIKFYTLNILKDILQCDLTEYVWYELENFLKSSW
jgi:hypothetical protein